MAFVEFAGTAIVVPLCAAWLRQIVAIRRAHPVAAKKHGTAPARAAPNLVRVVAENCRSA
jgi:hypothetical protein